MALKYQIQIRYANKNGVWDSYFGTYDTEEDAEAGMAIAKRQFPYNKFRIAMVIGGN